MHLTKGQGDGGKVVGDRLLMYAVRLEINNREVLRGRKTESIGLTRRYFR
jgi:hypothetical protein